MQREDPKSKSQKLRARLMDQQRLGGAATIDDLLDVLELVIDVIHDLEIHQLYSSTD